MSTTPVQYPASKPKIVINFVISGFLLLIGIPLLLALFDDPGEPFGYIGVVTALAGIAFIVFTFRRNIGRKLVFYDDRVELQVRGQTQAWRYDEIDGICIPAGQSYRRGQVHIQIKRFEFFTNGERAFTIPPVYVNWTDAGQRLTFEIKKRLAAQAVQRIADDQEVVFDLKSANLGRSVNLKLDARGITTGDDVLFRWSAVAACGLHQNNPGLVVVDTTDKNQAIAFRYYGSVNSMVAMDVIRAMFAQYSGA